MIKNILLTFFACLIIHSGFIYYLSSRNIEFHGTQNMWQENITRMQKYIYSDNYYEQLILGSSLSMRILVKNDDSKLFNLAAGGGDPFIGFEIIKRSNKIPKRIFVETNSLLIKKVHDDTYLSALYRPGLYQLRSWAPIFKEANQPLSFFGQGLLFSWRKILERNTNLQTASQPVEVIDTVAKIRISQNKFGSAKFDDDKKDVAANLQSLTRYLDFFKSKGVTVCFFEMPVDCATENSMITEYARKTLENIIKQYNAKEIPAPPCEDYQTSDGRHLTELSAIKYTGFFFGQAEKLK